jgi:hypothetical protein
MLLSNSILISKRPSVPVMCSKNFFWYPVRNGYKKQNVINFFLNFAWKRIKELFKVVFVKYEFTLLIHFAKLTNNGTFQTILTK